MERTLEEWMQWADDRGYPSDSAIWQILEDWDYQTKEIIKELDSIRAVFGISIRKETDTK